MVLVLSTGVLGPALAGCGLIRDAGTGAVRVTITSDFGARRLAGVSDDHAPGSETLLRLMEQRFRVRLNGNQVVAIDGVNASPGRRWFLWVNGSASGIGPPKRRTLVRAGDRIWWDLHDDAATPSVPVVVGSFPEPFIHGLGGRRLPVTLECAADVTRACDRVASALAAVGIPAPRQLIGTGSGTSTLGIVVAPWSELQGEIAALLISHGPSTGGVYARFGGRDDGTLELLDAGGHVVQTLGAGSGLIAATSDMKSAPTWLVTGTDVAGVSAAASALGAAQLGDRLAVAVHAGRELPVPR